MDLGLKLHAHKNSKVNAIFIYDIVRASAAAKSKRLKVGDQILEVSFHLIELLKYYFFMHIFSAMLYVCTLYHNPHYILAIRLMERI